jgi:hypothetical protein
MHHNSVNFSRNCLPTNQMMFKMSLTGRCSGAEYSVSTTEKDTSRQTSSRVVGNTWQTLDFRTPKNLGFRRGTDKNSSDLGCVGRVPHLQTKFRGKQKCLEDRTHHCPPVAVRYVYCLYDHAPKFVRSCKHTTTESNTIYSHALNTTSFAQHVWTDATHRLMVIMIYQPGFTCAPYPRSKLFSSVDDSTKSLWHDTSAHGTLTPVRVKYGRCIE